MGPHVQSADTVASMKKVLKSGVRKEKKRGICICAALLR